LPDTATAQERWAASEAETFRQLMSPYHIVKSIHEASLIKPKPSFCGLLMSNSNPVELAQPVEISKEPVMQLKKQSVSTTINANKNEGTLSSITASEVLNRPLSLIKGDVVSSSIYSNSVEPHKK
jgi:hypothetical protein